MNARTTKCQNWRRHADTIAHKSEKMANLQSRALARVVFYLLRLEWSSFFSSGEEEGNGGPGLSTSLPGRLSRFRK